MQAKRKIVDPTPSRPAAPGETEGWAPSGDASTVSAQSSPAHLMLRDLASRLTEPTVAAGVVALPPEQKWPVPARLAVIAALGLTCWAGLLWAAISIL